MPAPSAGGEAGTPGSCAVQVAGETLVLRADRTAFWPRAGWLLVADVHVGKAESLRRDGVALPAAVLAADLDRLAAAVRATAAARVLVLGDLVHDAHGVTPEVRARVAHWRAAVDAEVSLVPGNHDRRAGVLPEEWRIARAAVEEVAPPFVFSHDRLASAGAFNWHGHLHPALVVRRGPDALKLPCFVLGPRHGVLPAFSGLAGGMVVPRAPGERRFVVAADHVLAVGRGAGGGPRGLVPLSPRD